MSKTLPEGMGDPEYKMVMERKQQRMVETKGKSLIETNPYLAKAVKEGKLNELLTEMVITSTAVEGVDVSFLRDEIKQVKKEQDKKSDDIRIVKSVKKKNNKLFKRR